jgi:hypothetical protein
MPLIPCVLPVIPIPWAARSRATRYPCLQKTWNIISTWFHAERLQISLAADCCGSSVAWRRVFILQQLENLMEALRQILPPAFVSAALGVNLAESEPLESFREPQQSLDGQQNQDQPIRCEAIPAHAGLRHGGLWLCYAHVRLLVTTDGAPCLAFLLRTARYSSAPTERSHTASAAMLGQFSRRPSS